MTSIRAQRLHEYLNLLSIKRRYAFPQCGILCHGKSINDRRPFARWRAYRRQLANSARDGKGLRLFFGHQVACIFLAIACTGCCTFNACIPDLAFTSLTQPTPSELQGTSARGNLWRLQLEPSDLELRFSTKLDLFHLQERNGGFGSTVSVTLCDDKSGFISFGRVYTDDGWAADALLYDNSYTKHVATVEDPQLPPTPLLRRAADGRNYL